jgi:hypothetical protein
MTPRARALVAYAIALTVLAGVFALYTQPQLLVTLSEQIWACFN